MRDKKGEKKMERVIFVFTTGILLMNLVVMCGRNWNWPKLNEWISPSSFLFVYPSIFWQLWYWSPVLMKSGG